MNANQPNANHSTIAIRPFFYSLISLFTFSSNDFLPPPPHLSLCTLVNLLNTFYCRLKKKFKKKRREDLECIWSTEILFDRPVIRSQRVMHPRWAASLSLFICTYECLCLFHLRGERGGGAPSLFHLTHVLNTKRPKEILDTRFFFF